MCDLGLFYDTAIACINALHLLEVYMDWIALGFVPFLMDWVGLGLKKMDSCPTLLDPYCIKRHYSPCWSICWRRPVCVVFVPSNIARLSCEMNRLRSAGVEIAA